MGWLSCYHGELTANPIARGKGRGSAWKTLKDLGLVGAMSQIRRRLFKDGLFSPDTDFFIRGNLTVQNSSAEEI